MKKIDLGQIVSIFANVGVIAGIVFLGYELQQNNELLEAEARGARNEKAAVIYAAPYSNPALATALAKLELNEELTPAESIQVQSYAYSHFRIVEGNFAEIHRERLDEMGPIQAWRGILNDIHIPWRDYWVNYKRRATPEFAVWFETNIINATK
jgi:hypothetical protein